MEAVMTLHQPVMEQHHLPHWVGTLAGAAVALAVVIALAAVIVGLALLFQPAASTPTRLVISGSTGGGIEYMGIPWRTGAAPGIPVQGAHGGGILYVGIPYPPPETP
jgi:hypothetical protein